MAPVNKAYPTLLISMLSMTACTSMPTRVHDSGIQVEPVSNDAARIRSVGFWTDRDRLTLRGEVLPASSATSFADGHVDISITTPDGSRTVCTVAEFYIKHRYADKDFSHPFASLPPRGSRVRVWYHAAAPVHDDCSA